MVSRLWCGGWVSIALLSCLLMGARAGAATLTWDPGNTANGATIDPASGTWDLSATLWNNAGANVPWTQTNATTPLNAAVFAGPDGAYAINVGASIAAQSLTFNASGYALSATSPQQIFVPSGAPVSVLAGKLMTVGNNVTITSNGSTYTVQPNASNVGGGTLLIESGGVVQSTGAGTLGISGSGSTVTVNAGGTLRQTGNGVISVGQPRASGVGATLNVSGGTVSAAGGNLQIANALSTGTLAGPAVGTLNVNSGTVTIGLGGALLLNTGTTTATNFASATANINGGSLTTGTGGVVFGTSTTPDATGVVNLNGGTLTTNRFVRTNGSATVNFNGGTLKASASNGTFMQGLDAANVKAGGAVIDTNGFNLTIAQPLLDGGGGGGLTKNGAGALQLIGANTYVGPTAVNAGALYVDSVLAASPVSVASGGTLGGIGQVGGAVTLASGGHVGGGTANTAGNLTVGGLTLNAGALLDHEVGDLVTVTDPGGLTLNGGKVNLFSTFAAGPLTTPGTYTLIDYNGSFAGSVASLGVGNPIAGKLYTFQNDAANTAITLTVADATSMEWTGLAGDGLWTTAGNWSGGIPNSAGITARFGTTPPAGATVVQVSGPKTVGVLTFDNAGGYTINGGAADVITLNSASSTPAGILANSGNHTINAPLALASDLGAIIASGSTVTIGGNVTGATKNLTVNGGGTLVLLGTDSYAATTIAAATLQVGNGGTTGNLGTGPVTLGPGGRLVMNRSDEARLESGVVGAEGTVVQEGTGTLVLSNVNTFGTAGAGGLQVLGGTVQVGSATGLPAGVLVTVDNEATLDLHGFNATLGSLLVDAGTVTDTSSTAGTTTLTVNQTGNTTFTGALRDGPSRKVALTKQGAGTLTLDGTVSNTYSGLTTVTGGTLSLAKIGGAPAIAGDVAIGDASGSDVLQLGAADQIADSSVISFTAGASGSSAFFRLKGNNETVRGLTTTVAAAAVVENDGPAGTATLTVDTAGNDYTYDGIFRDRSTAGNAGLFALVKAGAGTLTIANTVKVVATSYTGGTTVTGGRLVLDNLDAFSSPITNNSAVADGLTINQTTRNLSLGAGAVISGSGGVTKTGPGTLTLLSTSNSYSGNTVIAAGTLVPGGSGAIPSGLGKGNVVLDGGASAAGTLNLNGVSVDINGLSGAGGAVLGQVVNNGAAPATLNLGNGDASATFAGVIRDNAGTGNIIGVTKTGTGVQTLAGANAYSDATTVNGGTLRVSGSIAASSGVNVNGGTFEAAASQAVKGISVQPGGAVKVTAAPSAARTVLKIGDNVNPAPLTVAAGTVDLVSNAIAVDVAAGSEGLTLGVVRLLVIGGYNATPAGAGNGKWDGLGIVSSTAAAPGGGNKGVGYALASEAALGAGNTFLGTGVDGSSVLARYTLLGDATLDGVVDFNDLVKLAQNYNTTVSATTDSWWFNGDFTYDGVVDFNDLVKLAQNYNGALPGEVVPGAPAGFDGELAAAMAAVPEPSAVAAIGVAATALVARGRRARAR